MQPEEYKKITILPKSTLLEGLKQMDVIRRKLLLVLDGNRYVGLLSIGDIQRAIIQGVDLNSYVSTIIRDNNVIVNPEASIVEIKKLMLSIRAEFMPVVSNKNKLLKVYFWEDLFVEKDFEPAIRFDIPVVIMAGGIGTRLKPLTNVLPKPLLPLGEKTMVEEIFERFGKHGCKTFYISVNYKAELIEYYLLNQHLPYELFFFREEYPMGTAGSLSLLKGTIKETFFVSNCDILIEQDYSEILNYHKENKNEITLIAALKHFPIAYGTIESGLNGQLKSLIEKPELTFKINSGMYILEPHLLEEIPADTFYHITHLIDKVKLRGGKVGVFPVSEKSWKDMGSWNDYLNLINI